MAAEFHVNDIGTAIILTIKDELGAVVDVSTAITKKVTFKKPDKSTIEKNLSLYTDGTDGIVKYVFQSGELDQQGSWRLQAWVQFSGGSWYSSQVPFEVQPNLENC